MVQLENDCNPSVHFIDLIKDYQLDISIDELERHYKAAVLNKDMQLLPAPFGLRSKVSSDCRIQLVMSKGIDGNYTILKHIVIPNKCKASVMKQLVYGILHKPNFMHIPTMGRKIVQYCLQNMGGLQFRCFDLAADVSTTKIKKAFDELDDDDLDKGFDFIVKHAPRSSSDLQQLRWQTKELRKSSSPIYAWPQGLVQQALRQLSAEGALARKEYDWPLPLTPVFFQTWLLEILEEIWNFDLSALVMLGEPACGKSPLGRSVLMAQCRFNQKKFNIAEDPSIRCSPELDFFRGEAGTVIIGDFLDDPCTQTLGLKALKSLLDVGLYESMSWARWGAVKWVQNQPRALAANAYDADVDEGESFVSILKFPAFWEIVRPCLCKEATKADVDAILKRATFLVNTKQFVYYRKNGVNEEPVPRKNIPGAEYLTDEGKKWYGKFKSNEKDFPPNFAAEVQKEQAWLALLFKKLQDERRPDWVARQKMRGLFSDPSSRPSTTCLQQVHANAPAGQGNSNPPSTTSFQPEHADAVAGEDVGRKKHSVPFVKMENQEQLGLR